MYIAGSQTMYYGQRRMVSLDKQPSLPMAMLNNTSLDFVATTPRSSTVGGAILKDNLRGATLGLFRHARHAPGNRYWTFRIVARPDLQGTQGTRYLSQLTNNNDKIVDIHFIDTYCE